MCRRTLGSAMVLGVFSFFPGRLLAQPTGVLWSATASASASGYVTAANWTGGVTPSGPNKYAEWGATTTTATIVGMGLGTSPGFVDSNDAGVIEVAALDFTTANARTLTVGAGVNSPDSGYLLLTGATIDGTSNVILANDSSHQITIAPNVPTASKVMKLGLYNATAGSNVIETGGTGGITVSAVIADYNLPSAVASTLTFKGGPGALTLSNTNTYSGGTTIQSGTLNATAAGALSTGEVNLAGGTLQVSNAQGLGTGMINAEGGALVSTVNLTNVGGLDLSAGSVSLGNGSMPGSLTFKSTGNFAMSGGSLDLQLGASSTQLVGAGGTFTISGGTIDLTLGSGFLYGQTYDVLSGFSSGSVSDLSFTGYDTTDYSAQLSSDGELSFAAVPEPASYAIMMGGAALLVAFWRQRKPVSAV